MLGMHTVIIALRVCNQQRSQALFQGALNASSIFSDPSSPTFKLSTSRKGPVDLALEPEYRIMLLGVRVQLQLKRPESLRHTK